MPRGQVKWFSDQKGYGFIQQEDGGQDVFVHHSNITMDGFRSLSEGQAVEYELEKAGLTATCSKLAELYRLSVTLETRQGRPLE